MQFIGVADDGPGFFGHLPDGGGVERADAGGIFDRKSTAELDGAGAALFEGRVVEVGIGIRVEDLVREGRWLWCVNGGDFERAIVDAFEKLDQAADVHRFMQTVRDRFVDERMIGNARFADKVFGARDLIGKDGGKQVVGAHALERRRNFFAAGEPRDGEGPGSVPFPAGAEHRGIEQGLREDVLDGLGTQELEDRFEGERVLITEREQQAVVGGGGLKFEVECSAEALAKSKSPGPVDARSEGRVDDELHSAAFIEETFGDDGVFRGHCAESAFAGENVEGGLFGSETIECAFVLEHFDRVRRCSDVETKARDFVGQLARAAGSFAAPERDGRSGSAGIFDAEAAGLDAADLPGRGAEHENIAGHALDGEVFIDGADDGAFGLGDDLVLRSVGDGSAAGDCGETCSAASSDAMVDLVAMEESSAASARGCDPFGEHFYDGIKDGSIETTVWVGAADESEEVVFVPIAGCRGGDDLLGEDVERRVGNFETIEFTFADRANERGAFNEFVARGGEEAAFGKGADPMPGAADALKRGRDRSRRSDLDDKIDSADIDSELERSGGDDGFEFAGFEALFGVEPQMPGEAAMMREDGVRAETFRKMMRDAFGEAPRVDKDECGAIFAGQPGDAVVDFVPHFIAGDGAEFVAGDFDGELHLALVADLDDFRFGAEKLSDFFDRADSGGEADFLERAAGQSFETRNGESEMRASFVAGDGVNLVEDQSFHGAQHFASAFRSKKYVQRFGRGDENVRRFFAHRGSFGLRRISGADGGPDGGEMQASGSGQTGDSLKGDVEIFVNVVAQGFERRYIEYFGSGWKLIAAGFFNQLIERDEERGKCFPGSGGRGDKNVVTGANFGPSEALGFGNVAESR